MGCCLSKTDENQDKMFDTKGSFSTDSKTESGEYIIRLWPRKDRQGVERIKTNKHTIVMSVDPKADDEKDPHSHAGVLRQSADAQNSPPLYYTIIFRY